MSGDQDGEMLMHATCVAAAGRAVLLRGPSGSGKSDLALRLVAMPQAPLLPTPFMLVADDQVLLSRRGGSLAARPPPGIRGLIEVRGLGIRTLPVVAPAEVALVVDLDVAAAPLERLPEPATVELLGIALPLLRLDAREASAPIKIALALMAAAPPLE